MKCSHLFAGLALLTIAACSMTPRGGYVTESGQQIPGVLIEETFKPDKYERVATREVVIDGTKAKVNVGLKGRTVTLQSSRPSLLVPWNKNRAVSALVAALPAMMEMCPKGQTPRTLNQIYVNANFISGELFCVGPGESSFDVLMAETHRSVKKMNADLAPGKKAKQ